MRRWVLPMCVAVVATAVAAGCGGAGPSSPSSAGAGVEVQGVVLGDGASFGASSGTRPAGAKAQKVTVQVAGTTITAEVSANGTFVLKAIPSGTFTLVFMIDGQEIGRILVTAPEGSEVKVVVQVKDSVLTLIEIKIESGEETPGASPSPTACVISGGTPGRGIELEGTVDSGTWELFKMKVNGERASALVDVTASSASYRCIGGAKTDTTEQCKALVAAGHPKVHVRGTLMTCDAGVATVTATEVKIQKD